MSASNTDDSWEAFRENDGDPIASGTFKSLNLSELPEDIAIWLMDDYLPDTIVMRQKKVLCCRIEEHFYTKYWQHRFSAHAFADAMQQGITRLINEGHPFTDAEQERDDDVHLFIRWTLKLPCTMSAPQVIDAIKAAFDLVWRRAEAVLEHSDTILVLGKDTGTGLPRLHRISEALQELGYRTTIIKEQPDRPGEGTIQKVLRHALSAKFVLVENSEASGHLYELPHVTKAAECITVVLQEEGTGATWMFEDAYAKHLHWHKISYLPHAIEQAVRDAADWAEAFHKQYAFHQTTTLPWRKTRP